jgi:putative transposase
MPKPPRPERKVRVDLREMLNAIRYTARSSRGWRMLPTNFGLWQTIYRWFRRFVRRMLFQMIHNVSLMRDRELTRRRASPTARLLRRRRARHATRLVAIGITRTERTGFTPQR